MPTNPLTSESPLAPKLLRIREAASCLNISGWKLRQLVANGKIRFVKIGDRSSPLLFAPEFLHEFIRQHTE
jgi:excisionase family DNA binding protein